MSDPADDGQERRNRPLSVVMNPYTRAALDFFTGNDRAFAVPFVTIMDAWMERFGFRDEWIFDNATATLTAAVITRINDPADVRRWEWRRSLDPECGRFRPFQHDDPEWLFEQAEPAAVFGKRLTSWFNGFLKETKAEIQFRQAELFECDKLAYFTARRFAGDTYPAIGRSAKVEIGEEDVRKGVIRYCDRTGLSLPGEARRNTASVN
jgi:hypothetical protein